MIPTGQGNVTNDCVCVESHILAATVTKWGITRCQIKHFNICTDA